MRVSGKIAWNHYKRFPVHAVLIVLIIALPSMIAASVILTVLSAVPTNQQLADYELGTTQAAVRGGNYAAGFTVQRPDSLNPQSAEGDFSQITTDELGMQTIPIGPFDIKPLFPEVPADGWLVVQTRSGYAISLSEEKACPTDEGQGIPYCTYSAWQLIQGDLWAPELSQKYRVIAGTPPQNSHEILVSRAFLERDLKRTISQLPLDGFSTTDFVTGEAIPLRIVGVMDSPESVGLSTVFAQTDAFFSPSREVFYDVEIFYMKTATPPVWSQIVELNKQGVTVLSRSVIASPPPQQDVPAFQYAPDSTYTIPQIVYAILFAVLIPLLLLPVSILAGSAFAFSARRQTRTLGVLASLGAEPGILRSITRSTAVWLGFVGGVLGAALGTYVYTLVHPTLSGFINSNPLSLPNWNRFVHIYGLNIAWLPLLAVVAFGMFAALVVSWLPARRAARVNALDALRGARLESATRFRYNISALVIILLGAAGLIFSAYRLRLFLHDGGVDPQDFAIVVALGVLSIFVIQLGFQIGSTWIFVLGRLVFAPLDSAANFAMRDLLGNRRRFQAVLRTSTFAFFLTGVFAIALATAATQAPKGFPSFDPVITTVVLIGAFFVLISSGIALSLSTDESRPDHATLKNLGATGFFRFRVVAWQAVSLTLISGLIGGVSSWLLLWMLLSGFDQKIVIPNQYYMLVLGAPIVLFVVAAFIVPYRKLSLTRSSID